MVYNICPMLLYALGNQASIAGFIEFLGIAEPDQVVGGVIVGVLHGVIQMLRRQAQWAYGVLIGLVWEAESLKDH